MKSISIRDIGKGIVQSQSPYNQQLGSFSAFLSEERKEAWHRINSEHLLALQNQKLANIEQIMYDGFIHNATLLRNIDNELQNININISLGFKNLSKQIQKSHNLLEDSNILLKNIHNTLSRPEATRAEEKALLASNNIKESISMSTERAKILLEEAIILLKESIEISPFDYRAHFDLGYVNSFYKNNNVEAENNFNNAVLRSLQKDKKFAVYSLRHLTDVRKQLCKYEEALCSIKEASDLSERDPQTQFEYTQILLLNNKEEEAKSIIIDLVENEDCYFDIAIVDPNISKDDDILKSLLNLRKVYIRKKKRQIISSFKDYWENDLVGTFVVKRNMFGKYKDIEFEHVKLKNHEQNEIKQKILQEIEDFQKLPFIDLRNNDNEEILKKISNSNQKYLFKLLKGKGKEVFCEMDPSDFFIESI
jgi:hypothetical protein